MCNNILNLKMIDQAFALLIWLQGGIALFKKKIQCCNASGE